MIVLKYRYLVGKRRRHEDKQMVHIISLLTGLQERCSSQESPNEYTPCSLLPICILSEDKLFCETVSKMILTLGNQQSHSLEVILDGIEETKEKEENKSNKKQRKNEY